MRTFTPAAVLAARGRLSERRGARIAIIVSAAGELAADKHPAAPARTQPPGFTGRVLSGAACGASVSGPAGILAGGVASAASTIFTREARRRIVEASGLPDPGVAVAEDFVALSLAAAATHLTDVDAGTEEHEADEENGPDGAAPPGGPAEGTSTDGRALDAISRGLIATAAGTAAMTLAQISAQRLLGTSPSEAPARVAQKVLKKARSRGVPRRERGKLNQTMHWLYGTGWGVPLGLASASGALGATPSSPSGATALTGAAFGLGVWSVGLIELPALDVAPPVWRQDAGGVALDVGMHLVYGIATIAALRVLQRR
ncbi:MAG TPA: hypothetical protein VH025_08115 [Solirubrobacteraceae bacterium]|jgi:uncharacterized membrane protein|nr:hypothetical protein [Solirubrobacteraceae bacterium]